MNINLYISLPCLRALDRGKNVTASFNENNLLACLRASNRGKNAGIIEVSKCSDGKGMNNKFPFYTLYLSFRDIVYKGRN